jgi:hypothetical protein
MRGLLLAVWLAGCASNLADPKGGDGGENGSDNGEQGGAAMACTHVDLLFAIDASGSTPKEQQALRDAFPGFATALGGVAGGLAD